VVEIIVALIAVFGAVLPYLLQKNKELNLKIAEQKREAYASFLKNFTEIAVAVMHDFGEEGKLVSLIFLVIRKDLLGKTRVTTEHLANLNPFNRG
jgi:hypothetical protein